MKITLKTTTITRIDKRISELTDSGLYYIDSDDKSVSTVIGYIVIYGNIRGVAFWVREGKNNDLYHQWQAEPQWDRYTFTPFHGVLELDTRK